MRNMKRSKEVIAVESGNRFTDHLHVNTCLKSHQKIITGVGLRNLHFQINALSRFNCCHKLGEEGRRVGHRPLSQGRWDWFVG